MSRLLKLGLVPGLIALAVCAAAPAQSPEPGNPSADWNQFRGPKRDDVSPDTNLLRTWPKDGPAQVWKATGVGEGFSSVAVAGDKVFTMGDKDGSSWVFGLDRKTGKNLWETRVGKAGGNYTGTRCTPTADGDRVYAIGQFGDLVCVEASTGKEVWRKNFAKDFGGRSGGWNFTESPLIDGERLVCTPGGKVATVVALNKKTGEEIWRSPIGHTAGYSSIVISNGGGVKQYVQLTAAGTIGVAASDGKLLWHYDRFDRNTANIPTPVVLGEQILTCTGYGKGGALLTLSADGEGGVKMKEEYHVRNLTNKHGGVVVVGDLAFGDSDSSGNVFCADWKTGKSRWVRQRKGSCPGSGSAAVTYADGHLYVRYENGWVALVPAAANAYKESGSFKIPNSSRLSWAHPVVIGGRLYLREKGEIYCYDVKAK